MTPIHFPVSGVETWLWLPPLVAFLISFFTSMGGVSGAFLLLPFQMSVLGYVAPSVSATNLVFNLVATPGGVYRYAREGRLDPRLLRLFVLGGLPGMLAGFWLRVRWLADAGDFKLFVAAVLAYIARRLLFGAPHARGRAAPGNAALAMAAGIVGVVGGIYGIGGGAILAPVAVALFRLPVERVAGAALASIFLLSLVGVLIYQAGGARGGECISPDWALGLSFGLGGLAGMYRGARCQRRMPGRWLNGCWPG